MKLLGQKRLLRWHLGLGDALICNGLVRTLVARGDELTIPCYAHNEASVRKMFQGLEEQVDFEIVTEIPEAERNSVNIGYYGEHFDESRWDESFYRQAYVPFLNKWERFNLPGDINLGTPKSKTAFIHDDKERGFVIPLDHGYRPEKTETIFDHLGQLMSSERVHCINSCFAILLDLSAIKSQERYLHHYVRPAALPIFGREWEILREP